MCGFWKIHLPRGKERDENLEYMLSPEEYSNDNLLCIDYIPQGDAKRLPRRVASHLEKGILYAVGYPDVLDPSAYREVCKLR